ncbi:sensory rhodopsin transducer [Microbacterium resistens]|uniref:sensory rhodopsin transducer n=1 Tax=Microbacterium resistens TaxID=156977 RepID=UPI00082D8E66|nr:sensory rhodopsin transducer [Microbacterium resistens]
MTSDVRDDRAGLGARTWVIADGCIPPGSTGDDPALQSHESFCVLNAGDEDAQIIVLVYFADREPAGPYRLVAPARRAFHQQVNRLDDPEPVPPGVDYCLVIRSDRPIVVQHTRLDSRQAANALMTTIAFPVSP